MVLPARRCPSARKLRPVRAQADGPALPRSLRRVVALELAGSPSHRLRRACSRKASPVPAVRPAVAPEVRAELDRRRPDGAACHAARGPAFHRCLEAAHPAHPGAGGAVRPATLAVELRKA